jgi:CRISPR-associated protein (TIGR02710 family)
MTRALLITVGTGDMARLEESLFVPLRKSIEQGEWQRVVLLPSRVTEHHAAELQARCGDLRVDVQPLPAAGIEDDADACFAHFDLVVSDLRDAGYLPSDIVADFTRGTKAMSAALVLAAVRHELTTLRYITGPRDDRHSMVRAGTERIFETTPTIATARKRLDTARQFGLRGNFAGALALLPSDEGGDNAWPEGLRQPALALRPALDVYAAWDRLDYRTAAAISCADEAPLREWQPLWPTVEAMAWVAGLAEAVPPDDHGAMAARLRRLACDLLANGERRIRDRHYEDAVLRAYRVLELIGQFRLFDRGLDSGRLPADHPAVRDLSAKLAKRGSAAFGEQRDGTLTAAREQTARLLKHLGDPLAADLLGIDNDPELPKIASRNHSVLIHGFQAVGPDDDGPLKALYRNLEALLVRDNGTDAEMALRTARQAGFPPAPTSAP